MCQRNKRCVMTTGTRSYATVVEEVLLWLFPIESFYTTSYLIFSRLLSMDSSRTSWGKRIISLSWSPWENKTTITNKILRHWTWYSWHLWCLLHTHFLACFLVFFPSILLVKILISEGERKTRSQTITQAVTQKWFGSENKSEQLCFFM